MKPTIFTILALHFAASSVLALDPHAPPVGLDDRFDQTEAESRPWAFRRLTLLDPVELGEDLILRVLRNAESVICHFNA